MNEFLKNIQNTKPEVGLGATEVYFSDRDPYTIINIISDKKIQVQRDSFKRIDNRGISDAQEYEYSRDPNGTILTLTLRRNGKWKAIGINSSEFKIGFRERYYDYTF